jgi:Tfp pilus assembly protein PilX
MRTLRNEHGIALVTSLMLTLITLAIVMAALYFITQQTQLSGASKRYKNSLEASHGGVEVFAKEIMPKVFNNWSTSQLQTAFSGINLSMANVTNACMKQKLNEDTKNWSACGPANKTWDPRSVPDVKFTLMGEGLQPGFNVYAKLVHTQAGNSDTSGFELLDSGSGVTGVSSGVSPKHVPAIYRIEVQGEGASSAREKASLSVLYAY